MKVSEIKELLSKYSDNDELMIAWNDINSFEYIYELPLPQEIWSRAVRYFDNSDMQDFNDECHFIVVIAKDEVEKETNANV